MNQHQRGTLQPTPIKLLLQEGKPLPGQGKLLPGKAAICPIQASGSFIALEFCPDQGSRSADPLALACFRQIGACLE